MVYDKRIILGKGEDTIPFGYYWSPATVSAVSLVPQTTQTVPDHILFTLVQPSTSAPNVDQQQMEVDTDSTEEEMTEDIDLMGTDNESDMDYESENDYDRTFINDVEMSDEEIELSFYRRLNNFKFFKYGFFQFLLKIFK